MCEIKNALMLMGLSTDQTLQKKKKKISELEDITTETIQNETKKRVFKNEESV